MIVEEIVGIRPEQIPERRRALAESALGAPAASFEGVELYEDLPLKAAVLCARLIRNHPLPDGNKRVGLVSLLEFLARNNLEWRRPADDDIVTTIERVAAGELSEEELAGWIRKHLGDERS